MSSKKTDWINFVSQIFIPTFTLSAQLAYSIKYPEWGIVLNLLAQPFWLYASWKSYKEAGQIGILITTIAFSIITIGGVINYWFL